MGSPMGRTPRMAQVGSHLRLIGALFLLLTVIAALFSACAPDAHTQASQNKTKLDNALHSAKAAGVPTRRLDAIIVQENTLAASTASGSSGSYQAAADGYNKLYNQVTTLQNMSTSQAQAQATGDLSTLQSALAMAESSGIADVTTAAKIFDPTVPMAQQQLAAAKSTKDFFIVDGYILDQLAAVTQVLPDYQQIQLLSKLVDEQTSALTGKPATPHVLECATEGGEIPSFGVVPAQFWSAQSDYPIAASSPVMVSPESKQTYYFSAWPSQALMAFRSSQTVDDFNVLTIQLQAQIATLTADGDPITLAQAQASAVVTRFQNDVSTYQTDAQANNSFMKSQQAKIHDVPDYNTVWGLSNNSSGFAPPSDFYSLVPSFKIDPKYAQEASQDATKLAAAQSFNDLSAVTKTVQQQEQGMAYALLKVKAYYDVNITLQSLVNQGQSTTTNVTFNGVLYKTPNAYEYADDNLRYDAKDTIAIEDAQVRYDQSAYREGYVSTADATADYQAVEDEAQMFIHNLTAMITNLAQMPKDNNARKAWSMTSHQTDLDLINYYGLENTHVIVVSLREQKARLYANGKLYVGADGKPYAFDVTTGSPDKPTVPGIHCAFPPLKGPPHGDIFKSADPPGSPFYYKPTPVHYSFGYALYGYYMHDGWWRDATEMGYLTNLPHYDPLAFDGGSHGCINFHYANGDMGKVFGFSSAGIPIIVY